MVTLVLLLSGESARCSPTHKASHLIGTVTDTLGRPISAVHLELDTADGRIVARVISDVRGRFSVSGLDFGTFTIHAAKPGFTSVLKTVVVGGSAASIPIALSMQSQGALTMPLSSGRITRFHSQVSSAGSTVYHFSHQAIDNLPQGPNGTINQVILQSPSMVQDSNGQALPRAMDDALQYRINGVMLPNVQLLDLGQLSPRFAESIDVITGAMPAELGYRTGGVVDIRTRDGAIVDGGSFEYYGGQRATSQPSFEYGGSRGRLSYFVTGYFLHNERGLNPPTAGPNPINDFTNQGSGLGYLSYVLSPDISISAIAMSFVHDFGWPALPGQAQTFRLEGVPIYPSANVSDTELEQTHFGMIALKGSGGSGLKYQISLFGEYSSLKFNPDRSGDLIYNGLASKIFRSSFLNGSQADGSYHFGINEISFGYYFEVENVEVDNHALTFPGSGAGQTGSVPVSIVDNHNFIQALYGLYLQDAMKPIDALTINFGLRWDQMIGFIDASQPSPRFSIVYQVVPRTTILHAGASVYFVPPPSEFISVEDIRKFSGTVAEPAVPENSKPQPMTDYYFDTGIRQLIAHNLQLGLDSFFQLQHNVLDEGQFGSSLIFSPINYRRGRNYGVDATAEYKSGSGLSGYFNFSYIVAQVEDVASGQFNFDPKELAYISNHYVYIDQGQMFTASGGLVYQWRGFVLSLTSTAGSGLRTGFANTHTMPPYVEIDTGVRRDFEVARIGAVHGRVAVLNLLDKIYEFHNGTGIGVGTVPQYMARRAVYFGVGFGSRH
ncbi:MAG: TonB-dependent receptor [Candidatus Binataceae bacterium]|nr:TonB-dependent receptor [Candidatus Binataceae bacterium]